MNPELKLMELSLMSGIYPGETAISKRFEKVSKKINGDFQAEYKKILERKSGLTASERSFVSYVCAKALHKKQQEETLKCQDLKKSEIE